MPNVSYASTGKFQWHDKLRFSRFSRSEYYEAELDSLSADQNLDIRIDIGLDAPYLVGATSASTPYAYRRARKHIEGDHTDICILHLVRSGSLRVLHYGTRSVVEAGQFIILRSNAPFELEYYPGQDSEHTMLYASLPPDVVLGHFSGTAIFGRSIIPPAGYGRVAHELFHFIFQHGQELAPVVANALLTALLEEVSRIPVSPDGNIERPASIQDYRLKKIRSYLALHFTNPDLTTTMVAEACRISPRYLSYLLAKCGTSFSEVVWSLRLEKARQWLQTRSLTNVPIGSFAQQAGFKSASHFSHLFKMRYGCTPGQFRKKGAALIDPPRKPADEAISPHDQLMSSLPPTAGSALDFQAVSLLLTETRMSSTGNDSPEALIRAPSLARLACLKSRTRPATTGKH